MMPYYADSAMLFMLTATPVCWGVSNQMERA